jgi:hypothetical protein
MNDRRDRFPGAFFAASHGSGNRRNAVVEHDIHNRAAHRINAPHHWGSGRFFGGSSL